VEGVLEAERDQLPLWLPVALGTGIAAWFALPLRDQWTGALLFFGALAAAGSAGWATRTGRAIALFGLFAALGLSLIWWRAEAVRAPVLARPVVTTFHARVEAIESRPDPGEVRLLATPVNAPELPPRVRLTSPKVDLDPGALIEVRARLMPPAPQALPGAYDFARTAWFKRIGATGTVFDPPRIVSREPATGISARFADWRRRLTAHIHAALPGPEGAVAAALATGDQGALPEEDAEAMRRSGLAHLLSVSGLHVAAVVAAAMLFSLKLLALSPWLALRFNLLLAGAGIAALIGAAYTLLAGAEVPTVRALVAALLVLLGLALGREAITLRLVATGALIVLLFWPESLAGPSFQLSFAAVTAIVALHELPAMRRLSARREGEILPMRLARNIVVLLVTGVVVEFALTPIALAHFHQAGLFGAAANVVAIPLTTFVIMPLEALALLLDLAGLGAPAWWLTGVALAWLLDLAHFVAAAPGAVARVPTVPAAAFGLMVAGGLWLCLWRTRMRLLGTVPFALGASAALANTPPDLLVTGDGRHVAVRRADGSLAILRDRAGDYTRDMLAEVSGREPELQPLADLPEAACSADLCQATLDRGGREWRILMTRSSYLVPWPEMVRACAAADITVADRRLPQGCRPGWIKLDRDLLARTGGLAIRLREVPRVETVAERLGEHPWAVNPKFMARRGRRAHHQPSDPKRAFPPEPPASPRHGGPAGVRSGGAGDPSQG